MFEFEICVKAAVKEMKLPPDVKLKPEQLEVLHALFDGKDTIAVLPTGFGKSLIFQMLPFMMADKFDKSMIVIVVAPINAIMEEQVRGLRSKGIMACYVNYTGSGGTTYDYEEEDDMEETSTDVNLNYPTPLSEFSIKTTSPERQEKSFISFIFQHFGNTLVSK